MKMFKSILAVLLAAALVCFAGCTPKDLYGGAVDTDADKIVGTWNTAVDISEMINDEMNTTFSSMGYDGIEMPETALYVSMSIDFDEDGTCVLYLEEDETIESMKVYIEDLMDGLVEWMYVLFEGMGMSRESADESFESLYNMSIKEYMDQEMAKELNPETLAESFADIENVEGFYKIEKGKLYIESTEEELESSEEYVACTITDTTMTIEEGNTPGVLAAFEELGMEGPITFNKK